MTVVVEIEVAFDGVTAVGVTVTVACSDDSVEVAELDDNDCRLPGLSTRMV